MVFRTTTAKALAKLDRRSQLRKLSALCLANSESLVQALQIVVNLRIGAFRILSPLFPLYTQPDVTYTLEDLPDNACIVERLEEAAKLRATYDLRLSFHPDQFIVLNSPRRNVVESALGELRYQAFLADMVGAEVINLHLGGVYGNRAAAVDRFESVFTALPDNIRTRLSIENDDVSYAPAHLLPISERLGVPVVYDVHHHRCYPDGLSVQEATARCAETWLRQGREPYFHISSPKNGWSGEKPKSHSDYIDVTDFPDEWRALEYAFTLDVEAKAKELAVVHLMRELASAGTTPSGSGR